MNQGAVDHNLDRPHSVALSPSNVPVAHSSSSSGETL